MYRKKMIASLACLVLLVASVATCPAEDTCSCPDTCCRPGLMQRLRAAMANRRACRSLRRCNCCEAGAKEPTTPEEISNEINRLLGVINEPMDETPEMDDRVKNILGDI